MCVECAVQIKIHTPSVFVQSVRCTTGAYVVGLTILAISCASGSAHQARFVTMPNASFFAWGQNSQDLLRLPRPASSPVVGCYVVLRGSSADGPMGPADFGIVIEDTGAADRPYLVRLSTPHGRKSRLVECRSCCAGSVGSSNSGSSDMRCEPCPFRCRSRSRSVAVYGTTQKHHCRASRRTRCRTTCAIPSTQVYLLPLRPGGWACGLCEL